MSFQDQESLPQKSRFSPHINQLTMVCHHQYRSSQHLHLSYLPLFSSHQFDFPFQLVEFICIQEDKNSPSPCSKLLENEQNKLSSSLSFGFCCHIVLLLLTSAVVDTLSTFYTSRSFKRDPEENISL